MLLFICLWLCGWVMGEASALGQVLGHSHKPGPPLPFMAVWLTAWTLGGAYALLTVAWQLVGRETLGVESGHLVHRVRVLFISRTREYRGDQVRRLRALDAEPASSRFALAPPPLWGPGTGLVAFDHGSRSVRVGAALDEAEAPRVVELLRSRLPQAG
ncbi:MAG TPA: hypothetical protein VK188_12400 [Holophaga sp.]|nr:hypothetical protein [Holophaga sp.]